MKFTVNSKIDLSEFTKKIQTVSSRIPANEGQKMANAAVDQMKDLITSGNSPIKGYGKFPPYKDPAKYPGGRKSATPVNLILSGKFLSALKGQFRRQGENAGLTIGYTTEYARKLESGHREGVNEQPKRPTIPESNEEFVPAIKNALVEKFKELLTKVMREK